MRNNQKTDLSLELIEVAAIVLLMLSYHFFFNPVDVLRKKMLKLIDELEIFEETLLKSYQQYKQSRIEFLHDRELDEKDKPVMACVPNSKIYLGFFSRLGHAHVVPDQIKRSEYAKLNDHFETSSEGWYLLLRRSVRQASSLSALKMIKASINKRDEFLQGLEFDLSTLWDGLHESQQQWLDEISIERKIAEQAARRLSAMQLK